MQQIQNGLAQVEVEKTEEHNEMLNLIFPKRVTIGIVNATELSKYYSLDNDSPHYYRLTYTQPFLDLPIIHASDIILDNTVIKVLDEEGHGARVIEWWKEQGVDTCGNRGSFTNWYYGFRNGVYGFYDKYEISMCKIITLPELFPSKWYLKITNESKEVANEWRRSVATSHLNTYLDNTGYILLSKHEFDESFFLSKFTSPIEQLKYYSDYTELTTEQFLDHVYNPWKYKPIEGQILIKQENKMRTIKWQEAQEIIDIACKEWKERLFDYWGKNIVLKQQIEILEQSYQEMRKACTKEQHELFDRIFGKEKEDIDLEKETGIGLLDLFKKDGDHETSLMAIYSGSCETNIIWLNSERFSWELIDGYLLKVTNK